MIHFSLHCVGCVCLMEIQITINCNCWFRRQNHTTFIGISYDTLTREMILTEPFNFFTHQQLCFFFPSEIFKIIFSEVITPNLDRRKQMKKKTKAKYCYSQRLGLDAQWPISVNNHTKIKANGILTWNTEIQTCIHNKGIKVQKNRQKTGRFRHASPSRVSSHLLSSNWTNSYKCTQKNHLQITRARVTNKINRENHHLLWEMLIREVLTKVSGFYFCCVSNLCLWL